MNGIGFGALVIACTVLFVLHLVERKSNMEKTVEFSPELFDAVMANMLDYWQLGETVCGQEDPAVITIGEGFAASYPEFKGFTVVRVTEKYVSPWKSDTFLEFSNRDITSTEYQTADELTGE